jgi:DNA-binding PadR family transcriptional regulator
MELLSARTALIQALFEGPGYGVTLARRIRERTSGAVQLGRGNLYTVLRNLQKEGLVIGWTVVPGGRRGARARVYFELTPRGIEAGERQRRALGGLLAHVAPTAEPAVLMRSRLLECNELSKGVLRLRDSMREVTG